jgi:mono/diheme cytochrome c family protein
MQVQPRDEAYRLDPAFADGQAMRAPVPGTLSREEFVAGLAPAEPPRVTMSMLLTGRERFDVWCAPCHGMLADGDGPVARKMTLRPPPSLIVPWSVTHPTLGPYGAQDHGPASPGWEVLPREPREVFDIITSGYGMMPAYGAQLPPDERWDIVAYLRALAFSQRAPLAAADPAARARLLAERGTP